MFPRVDGTTWNHNPTDPDEQSEENQGDPPGNPGISLLQLQVWTQQGDKTGKEGVDP